MDEYPEYPSSDLGADDSARGQWGSFLTGTNKCRAYADGSVQSPSLFCWFFVVILVVNLISEIILCSKLLTGPAKQPIQNAVASTLLLAAQILAIFIMYSHCQRCNAWIGFFVVLVILFATNSVCMIISPELRNEFGVRDLEES